MTFGENNSLGRREFRKRILLRHHSSGARKGGQSKAYLVRFSDGEPKTFLLRAAKSLMKLGRNRADWASQKYMFFKRKGSVSG